MSRYSEEVYTELRTKIRKYFQLRPFASAKEVGEVFDIPHKTAWRLVRKVRTQIVEDLKLTTSDKDLAEYSEFLNQASPEIKRIIFDKDKTGSYTHEARDRINAFRALVMGQERMLGVKMDLGIYKRKLGEIGITPTLTSDQEKILEKALNYAVDRANKSGVGGDTPEQDIENQIS
jgi:hypothetical protein